MGIKDENLDRYFSDQRKKFQAYIDGFIEEMKIDDIYLYNLLKKHDLALAEKYHKLNELSYEKFKNLSKHLK